MAEFGIRSEAKESRPAANCWNKPGPKPAASSLNKSVSTPIMYVPENKHGLRVSPNGSISMRDGERWIIGSKQFDVVIHLEKHYDGKKLERVSSKCSSCKAVVFGIKPINMAFHYAGMHKDEFDELLTQQEVQDTKRMKVPEFVSWLLHHFKPVFRDDVLVFARRSSTDFVFPVNANVTEHVVGDDQFFKITNEKTEEVFDSALPVEIVAHYYNTSVTEILKNGVIHPRFGVTIKYWKSDTKEWKSDIATISNFWAIAKKASALKYLESYYGQEVGQNMSDYNLAKLIGEKLWIVPTKEDWEVKKKNETSDFEPRAVPIKYNTPMYMPPASAPVEETILQAIARVSKSQAAEKLKLEQLEAEMLKSAGIMEKNETELKRLQALQASKEAAAQLQAQEAALKEEQDLEQIIRDAQAKLAEKRRLATAVANVAI